MKTENIPDELKTMLSVINQIREEDYPQIPQKLIRDILLLENQYIGNRDKAQNAVSIIIDNELKKFD